MFDRLIGAQVRPVRETLNKELWAGETRESHRGEVSGVTLARQQKLLSLNSSMAIYHNLAVVQVQMFRVSSVARNHSDIRQLPVLLSVIQPVSYNEHVFDFKTEIFNRNLYPSGFWFAQKRSNL